MFGDEVGLPGPATPPISYGHPNGLGAALMFPEGGEVAVEHIFASSLDQAIKALERKIDYAAAGMAPFYLEFREKMQAAFPEETVGFSYSSEGPLTTAYELRGDAFFLDPFDQPDKTREFLRRLTDSILDFHRFQSAVHGVEPVSAAGAGLCDDIGSMIPPRMWDRFVLPYWEQYFNGKTTGRRYAHVEDLRPAQLRYLEKIGLWFYDPSISPQLTPRIITEQCRIPFGWRLGSFHYRNLDCDDVRDFVFQAVADGASRVSSIVEGSMCTPETAAKVKAFIAAGKEVKRLLDEGCPRAEIGTYVSATGKRKFWTTWNR
jgi:hypothetical protein